MLFLFVSCYILSCCNFLTIPVVKEKIKVRLAFAIPIDAPTILVHEIIDSPLLIALTINYNLVYVIKSSKIYFFFTA